MCNARRTTVFLVSNRLYAADGYVRSEACALMLLGSHSTTEAGGALVLLLGSAVNQGGRASSLTAPNGPSQQEVVRLALASAGL